MRSLNDNPSTGSNLEASSSLLVRSIVLSNGTSTPDVVAEVTVATAATAETLLDVEGFTLVAVVTVGTEDEGPA